MVVRLLVVWGEMLASQELTCPEDVCCEDEDVEMDLWHTRSDNIRNEVIRDNVGDKMREARLRWFGHVQRR